MSEEVEIRIPVENKSDDSSQKEGDTPNLTAAQKATVRKAVEKIIERENREMLERMNKEEFLEKLRKEQKERDEKEKEKKTFRMKKVDLEALEEKLKQTQPQHKEPQKMKIALKVAQHVLEQSDHETLGELSDKAVIQRYITLTKAFKAGGGIEAITEEDSDEITPLQQIQEALTAIKAQAEARSIELKTITIPDEDNEFEVDQLNSSPKKFQMQLIRQWESAVTGGAVNFVDDEKATEMTFTTEPDGRVTVIIPTDPAFTPTLEQTLAVATAIAPKMDGSQKTRGEVFAQNLKDTAIFLSQQYTGSEKALFSDAFIEELYNTGVVMEAAIQGNLEPERLTREQLKDLIIQPLLYQRFPEQIAADEKSGMRELRMQDRKEAVIMFFLGKKELTLPGEEPAFYEKWFTLVKAKGVKDDNGELIQTHEQFERYVVKRLPGMLPFLADAVEKNPETQKRRYEAVASQSEEILMDSISRKGEQLRKDMYKDMSFSKEQGKELTTIASEVLPPETLIANIEKQLALSEALNEDTTLPNPEKMRNTLAALNKAIYDTYKFPKNPSEALAKYAPLLALKNGEFACTIRARVLNDLVEMYMKDKFVSLAGTELGHETNFLVEKNSLFTGQVTGFLISTGGGKEGGYDITIVTDDKLEEPIMEKVKKAILENVESGTSVNIHVELNFIDENVADRFGRYMSLTDARIGLEANDWINLAVSGVGKDGQPLDLETQLLFAQRARYLDPKNVNAWRLIAQLTEGNPDMIHLHNTALEKVHALHADPDLTDEMILSMESTVNAPIALDTTAFTQELQAAGLNVPANKPADPFVRSAFDEIVNDGNAGGKINLRYVNRKRADVQAGLADPGVNKKEAMTVLNYLGQLEENLAGKEEANQQQERQQQDLQRKRDYEHQREKPTLFQLTEPEQNVILSIGPIRWFFERNALDFASRWASGVIPGGSAFEAFESNLRDAASFVTSPIYMTERLKQGLSYSEIKLEVEEFMKLKNDIVNVVLATTFFQDGGEKSLPEAENKLKSLNFDGIYRIRNMEDGKIRNLSQRYLQKMDMRRIQDGSYIHTHSIKDVQNEIVDDVYGETMVIYEIFQNAFQAAVQRAIQQGNPPPQSQYEAFQQGVITQNMPENEYLGRYLQLIEERENEFAAIEYLKDRANDGASMTEALREIKAGKKQQYMQSVDQVLLKQAIDDSFKNVIRSHLIIARWTAWAVLDEPAVTSKGIPVNEGGERKMEYTGRPSLWSHMQDMIRWGSLTEEQERYIWGPFRRRIIENALKALVTKKGQIDTTDEWHPDSQLMREILIDAAGVERSRFEMIENDDFINQVGFLSDRGIDSIWRMGDRGGMERPYLDVLYAHILQGGKFGTNINGEWLLRDANGRPILDREGYQTGLDVALLIQLHTAVSNVESIAQTRSKRWELWAGRIAKFQPEIAMKQVYEKDPYGDMDFRNFWNNAGWLDKFYDAKIQAQNTRRGPRNLSALPTFNDVLTEKIAAARKENQSRVDAANEKNGNGRKVPYRTQAEIEEVTKARFRFEIFMENMGEKLWEYRQKSFELKTPEAIDFGSTDRYKYKDANGAEVTGNWITDPNGMNNYFSVITDGQMKDVGYKVQALMDGMTATVRGGSRNRGNNSANWRDSIAGRLGCDANYQARLYKRALSDRDSLMEQQRFRQQWGEDLSNKGTNLSGLIGDLSASEQVMNIFVYGYAKGDFQNREEISKQVVEAGKIVQGPKGEGFRTKIIDDWLVTYYYAMKLGSKEDLGGPDFIGRFLNFAGWNIRGKFGSMAKTEFGAHMIGFTDEQIESYINNEVRLFMQGDPVRAEQILQFLGIKRGRMVRRSILRLIWALIIGAAMEATGTSVDLVGLQQGG